jgi:hypothetical protein
MSLNVPVSNASTIQPAISVAKPKVNVRGLREKQLSAKAVPWLALVSAYSLEAA